MALINDIRDIAMATGADFFGIADLAPVRDVVVAQGGDELAEFTRAVAIGIKLPDAIVDRLVLHADLSVVKQYRDIYNQINTQLDHIAASVADRLQLPGFEALAIPASHRTDENRLCGLYSHKLAAHLAGLGWIGKSCLLVTRQAGPRVRWVTVLTNATLPPTGGPVDPACGDCRQCVDACPVNAFTGRAFNPAEPRETRFDARKCEDYVAAMTTKTGCYFLCGLCVAACPHGK